MNALLLQLRTSLRLHVRNPMALIYGYAFPTIFLVAFWVLYRYDRVPLVRHMGELLTVTVLGGACFGLPTTLVSERERGVWRRVRLAPVSMFSIVGSTIAARYLLLVVAGMLQVALAMAIGMPVPQHPIELWLAFTAVAVAFLGLGLVIATLADTVPAVQALGQCIFLPMLIIGGVAVPLASLPDWAQHLSAFFPGRYAVDAIQTTVNGSGLSAARFPIVALLTIGGAAALAGGRLFRWDAEQRFMALRGKGWIAVSVAAWIAVGVAAETRGRAVTPIAAPAATVAEGKPISGAATTRPDDFTVETLQDTTTTRSPFTSPASPARAVEAPPKAPATSAMPTAPPALRSAVAPPAPEPPTVAVTPPTPVAPPSKGPLVLGSPRSAPTTLPAGGASRWQDVTPKEFNSDALLATLPRDDGIVTPIAASGESPPADVEDDLDQLTRALLGWGPGAVADPLQRVRNFLYVPSVVDVYQLPSEPWVPLLIFDYIQASVPSEDLVKILYWIATHPDDGDDTDKATINALRPIGLPNGNIDEFEVRSRSATYAVKLLGRITGKRPGR